MLQKIVSKRGLVKNKVSQTSPAKVNDLIWKITSLSASCDLMSCFSSNKDALKLKDMATYSILVGDRALIEGNTQTISIACRVNCIFAGQNVRNFERSVRKQKQLLLGRIQHTREVKRGDPIVRLEAGIMNKPPKHFMTKHTIQYKSFQIDHAQAF